MGHSNKFKGKLVKRQRIVNGKVVEEWVEEEIISKHEGYQESPSIYQIMDDISAKYNKIREDRAKRGCHCDVMFACTCGKK